MIETEVINLPTELLQIATLSLIKIFKFTPSTQHNRFIMEISAALKEFNNSEYNRFVDFI